MSPWLAELRWAWRRCSKRLGSSVAAVAVLALGLGLATAFHAVGRGILWRGLPVEDPHEIVTVGEASRPGVYTLPLDETPCVNLHSELPRPAHGDRAFRQPSE